MKIVSEVRVVPLFQAGCIRESGCFMKTISGGPGDCPAICNTQVPWRDVQPPYVPFRLLPCPPLLQSLAETLEDAVFPVDGSTAELA